MVNLGALLSFELVAGPFPLSTRVEATRMAADRSHEVYVRYGIHRFIFAVTDNAMEDQPGPALYRVAHLFATVVACSAAHAWAALHRPEGIP